MTDARQYSAPVCRGSWALGTACKQCERCEETNPFNKRKPDMKTPFKTPERIREERDAAQDTLSSLTNDLARLRAAVERERTLKDAYDAMPQDRGGPNGPKGKAYQLWMDARQDVGAALNPDAN